jgi:hypothetical protein
MFDNVCRENVPLKERNMKAELDIAVPFLSLLLEKRISKTNYNLILASVDMVLAFINHYLKLTHVAVAAEVPNVENIKEYSDKKVKTVLMWVENWMIHTFSQSLVKPYGYATIMNYPDELKVCILYLTIPNIKYLFLY